MQTSAALMTHRLADTSPMDGAFDSSVSSWRELICVHGYGTHTNYPRTAEAEAMSKPGPEAALEDRSNGIAR